MKNFKIKIAIPLIFFVLTAHIQTKAQDTTAIHPAQNNTLTLQQCIEIGFKNNPDVKQAGFIAESAKINYNQ